MFIHAAGMAVEWQVIGETISKASLALVAIWSQLRTKAPQPEPLEDLTFRLRHPLRWKLSHPLKGIRRKVVR
jgi:hypothetical protein